MMHALAVITGNQNRQSSEDTSDMKSEMHHHRQLTVLEDVVQIKGHPMYDLQCQAQRNTLALERRFNEHSAQSRSDLEHAAADIEHKLQLRLQDYLLSSQLALQSTVTDAIQNIITRVDGAEATLFEARSRLDKAVDIQVAKSQLVTPENIAQTCGEQIQEAMTMAQTSFNAAVEAKAEQHASNLELRLRQSADQAHVQTLNTIAAQTGESEERMQKRLETLLKAACAYTDARAATLETNLERKFVDFSDRIEISLHKRITADAQKIARKIDEQICTSTAKISADAQRKAAMIVADAELRIVKDQECGLDTLRKDMVSHAKLVQSIDSKFSSQIEALSLSRDVEAGLRELELKREKSTRVMVKEMVSKELHTIRQEFTDWESRLKTQILEQAVTNPAAPCNINTKPHGCDALLVTSNNSNGNSNKKTDGKTELVVPSSNELNECDQTPLVSTVCCCCVHTIESTKTKVIKTESRGLGAKSALTGMQRRGKVVKAIRESGVLPKSKQKAKASPLDRARQEAQHAVTQRVLARIKEGKK